MTSDHLSAGNGVSDTWEGAHEDQQRDVVSRLALSAAFEPGDEVIGAAVAEFGAVELTERLDHGPVSAISTRYLKRWRDGDWRTAALRELEVVESTGIRLLVPGSPDWPTQLDDLGDRAPLLLRARGQTAIRLAAVRCVSVVGARAATRYGTWVAEEVCAALAQEGWTVVSGAAMGIDAAAHRGAMAGGGRTFAVTAAGADLSVPSGHHSLYERIVDNGCVMSEVPIGAAPNRRRFLVRNRIIAALSPLTVVVEAALRSGALSTAREADAIGRVVAAIPGPVTSALSSGCHELIRRHTAELVTTADDIVELVLGSASAESRLDRSPESDLTAAQVRILEACTAVAISSEAIAARANVSQQLTAVALAQLERLQMVTRSRTGWKRAPTR